MSYLDILITAVTIIFSGITLIIAYRTYKYLKSNFNYKINQFQLNIDHNNFKHISKKLKLATLYKLPSFLLNYNITNRSSVNQHIEKVIIFIKHPKRFEKYYPISKYTNGNKLGNFMPNETKQLSINAILPIELIKKYYHDYKKEEKDWEKLHKYILSKLPNNLKYKIIFYSMNKPIKTIKGNLTVNKNIPVAKHHNCV